MPEEIEGRVFKTITGLTRAGNEQARLRRYQEAMETFSKAFDLIPEPKMQWEATTWVLSSIGDMWFLLGNFEKARDAFADAVRCPGGLGNSFIHLRLGQIAFEAQDRSRALNELTRAYMGGGREVFAKEDPKYLALLKGHLRPPVGKSQL